MGIGFVLIFWGVLGLIGATIGSAILRQIASDFTQGRVRSSPQLRAIRLFPFACIVWAAGVFISYAVINEVAFDRDAGIGDGWTCPLPNGYAQGNSRKDRPKTEATEAPFRAAASIPDPQLALSAPLLVRL